MKIGIYYNYFIPGRFARFGEERFQKLKSFGYDALDYSLSDTDQFPYTGAQNEVTAFLKKEKNMIADAGIEISQVHGPWRWPARDQHEEDRVERMEKMKRSLHMTAELGCVNWVIHPVMPYGIHERDTSLAEKTWQINLEFMGQLLEEAKKLGITICFENMPMPQFSIATPADIMRFVRAMDDDAFQVCLDTGHVAVCKEISAGDAVRFMGDSIKVFHIHDSRIGQDLHLMPFFGDIDWVDFGKALKDIRYEGVFSLETVPPASLPTELFEQSTILLNRYARQIISYME